MTGEEMQEPLVPKSDDDLREDLKKCPQKYSKWKHYKGAFYSVQGSAINEKTLEPMVLYSRMAVLPVSEKSCGKKSYLLFARPLSEWEELVEHEGEMVPRFTRFTRLTRLTREK